MSEVLCALMCKQYSTNDVNFSEPGHSDCGEQAALKKVFNDWYNNYCCKTQYNDTICLLCNSLSHEENKLSL